VAGYLEKIVLLVVSPLLGHGSAVTSGGTLETLHTSTQATKVRTELQLSLSLDRRPDDPPPGAQNTRTWEVCEELLRGHCSPASPSSCKAVLKRFLSPPGF